MKSIQIDHEGFFKSGEVRINDTNLGHSLLTTLHQEEKGEYVGSFNNENYLIEAFDEPFVARQVFKSEGDEWEVLMPYDYRAKFSLKKLVTDDWDRFHGVTNNGIPFVFSREAQAELFRLVDELTDESIIINGKEIPVPAWYTSTPEVNRSDFWTKIYNTEDPGWDMKGPSPVLVKTLPKLKLTRQRVIVLGCGEGHDAAYMAQQGHIVTAVDFSEEAINRAKKHYAGATNLRFFCADVFNLPENWTNEFDLILEHTCYCAVNPTRRNELIKIWKRLLAPGGHLLGIFFAISKFQGPPFGGTEYEVFQRLKKYFRFFIWERTKDSHPRRMGREVLVYGQVLGE